MGAITIPRPIIPEASMLCDQREVEAIDRALSRSAAVLAIPDGGMDAFEHANAVYTEVSSLAKSIETQREAIKRPALDFGRLVDKHAKDVRAPLDAEMVRLGALVKAWQINENRKRDELIRKANEERDRLQREADAQAEAERQAKAQQAADDAPPWEAPPAAEVFTTPAPRVQVPTAYIPPVIKSAVRSAPSYALVIDDAALIPREIAGAKLWVLDEAQVKKLLKAGIAIPGCRLAEVNGTAPVGR